MRVETDLLEDFKKVCASGVYQAKIRQLMKIYVDQIKSEKERKTIRDRSINTDFLTKY